MFEALERELESAVSTQIAPGLIAVAGTAETWDYVAITGVERYSGNPISQKTHYDLASLTKVVATLPAILKLVSAGDISLDDKVKKFFSNAGWLQTPSLAEATLQHLLTHTSGLPNWKPLFALTSDRQTALAHVLQTELEHPQGNINYSDLGFVILGAVVERVSGLQLDSFVKQEIFDPLGMQETSFGTLPGFPVAATEDCGWRGRLLQGEVHDENAFVLGGVAGHAGLFATAGDLATYAQAWLRLDANLGSEEVMLNALRQYAASGNERRALGWTLLPSGSAYHSGYTGTSLHLSVEKNHFGVLLSNRVHPTRFSPSGFEKARQTFHQVVASSYDT